MRLYKIGELAKLSGVPAKTIRYYSDIGALPPTRLLESGYRLYSDADRGRLELIRTLRDLDIGLPTIIGLLQDKVAVTTPLTLQLDAVEFELRTLQRRRALLKAALAKGEEAALAYLDRARAIAKLNALEREGFLSRHLERAFEGVPVDEGWKANFWQGAVLDLPEELTEAQLDAWLELAELIADGDFLRRLNEMGRAAWGALRDQPSAGDWTQELQTIYAAAIEAGQAGHAAHSAPGQQLVQRYIQVHARAMGRPHDPTFPADLLDLIERGTDPRAERYWELIAILKDWREMPPIGAAHRWLVEGLRWRLAQDDHAIAGDAAVS